MSSGSERFVTMDVALGSDKVGIDRPVLRNIKPVVSLFSSQFIAVTSNQYSVPIEKLTPGIETMAPCVDRFKYADMWASNLEDSRGSERTKRQMKLCGFPALPDADAVISTSRSHAPTIEGTSTETATAGGLAGRVRATACSGVRCDSPGPNITPPATDSLLSRVRVNPKLRAALRVRLLIQIHCGNSPRDATVCAVNMLLQFGEILGSTGRLNEIWMSLTESLKTAEIAVGPSIVGDCVRG